MRCIFILHTGESSIDNLPFSTLEPKSNPANLDYAYKYGAGEYKRIPTIWWASDSEVVPQVGWYVGVPIEPTECTDWGLDVKVVRVKLCRDYCCEEAAPISYVEITCRVVYEEG